MNEFEKKTKAAQALEDNKHNAFAADVEKSMALTEAAVDRANRANAKAQVEAGMITQTQYDIAFGEYVEPVIEEPKAEEPVAEPVKEQSEDNQDADNG